MKTFAKIDDSSNIIRIIDATTLTNAKNALKNIPGSSVIDITASIKCENFLEVGRVYVQEHDAVLPPKVFPSWVISDDKRSWVAPVAKPGEDVTWDEANQAWA